MSTATHTTQPATVETLDLFTDKLDALFEVMETAAAAYQEARHTFGYHNITVVLRAEFDAAHLNVEKVMEELGWIPEFETPGPVVSAMRRLFEDACERCDNLIASVDEDELCDCGSCRLVTD